MSTTNKSPAQIRYEEEKARIEANRYKTIEVKMSPSEAIRMKNVK